MTMATIQVHHNYFLRTNQRMPRVRYGKVHVFNNFYEVRLLREALNPKASARLWAVNGSLDE
jgi:pectate lyase